MLGLERGTVGVEDDFFQLGGDSILSIKMMNQVNKELGLNINISAVFKHRTIKNLLGSIEFEKFQSVQIEKFSVANPEEQLLSFAQERLWFINNYESGTSAYNVPMVFEVCSKVNTKHLIQSIKTVVQRHEVLRSIIKTGESGNTYQEVKDLSTTSFITDTIMVSNQEELNKHLSGLVNYIFRLDEELPIRIGLFKNELDSREYIAIIIHHIAFDGWSTGLFYKEIKSYYNLLSEGNSLNPNNIVPLSIQYRDYAMWQRAYLQNDILDNYLTFWKEQLTGYETLHLPTDKARPSHVSYAGEDINIDLGQELTTKLRFLAREHDVSMYSLLLSGFYLLLKTYSNQDDIVIGTPVANRHYKEIEDVIGFFVNTLALRQKIDDSDSLSSFIKQVGHSITEAQSYQDLPFEKIVDELVITHDSSRHPIVQVFFSLQSFENEALG
ncbi:condensation domain-containing protein, partial [Bacteroides ovatus]|uniref:condensation domain-containing protein n=1 Tax=Bacteroides ovatus TaxID=28116 RepID=UPI00216B0DE4